MIEVEHKIEDTKFEKCTKRHLNGYVGFSNLPNQIHRKSVKKGFNFTMMVVGRDIRRCLSGESGLGKSTMVNTLFNSYIYPAKEEKEPSHETPKTVEIQSVQGNISENGVQLHLTIIDTPGFGDFIDNQDCWKPILECIESRFNSYLEQESRVNQDIANHGIQIYQPLADQYDDEETMSENHELIEKMPFAVVGSTQEFEINGKKVRGRKYPWGVIEVDNEEHNDFAKLRQLLIRSNMEDLKEYTNTVLYENFRAQKLLNSSDNDHVSHYHTSVGPANHELKLKELESELRQMLEDKVKEKEQKLKKTEEELFTKHKEVKQHLENQKMELEERRKKLESLRLTSNDHKNSTKARKLFFQTSKIRNHNMTSSEEENANINVSQNIKFPEYAEKRAGDSNIELADFLAPNLKCSGCDSTYSLSDDRFKNCCKERLLEYSWECSLCKTCSKCRKYISLEDAILCPGCDRAFHNDPSCSQKIEGQNSCAFCCMRDKNGRELLPKSVVNEQDEYWKSQLLGKMVNGENVLPESLKTINESRLSKTTLKNLIVTLPLKKNFLGTTTIEGETFGLKNMEVIHNENGKIMFKRKRGRPSKTTAQIPSELIVPSRNTPRKTSIIIEGTPISRRSASEMAKKKLVTCDDIYHMMQGALSATQADTSKCRPENDDIMKFKLSDSRAKQREVENSNKTSAPSIVAHNPFMNPFKTMPTFNGFASDAFKPNVQHNSIVANSSLAKFPIQGGQSSFPQIPLGFFRNPSSFNSLQTGLTRNIPLPYLSAANHTPQITPNRIRTILFGKYEIDPWYSAPYPEEYITHNGILYICEYCFKYMKSYVVLVRHMVKCKCNHPPGDEIYRHDSLSIFEVNGSTNKIYCQNLCLFAKMFLDHKTLYYDVEPFLFYILTEWDNEGCHFVGYFSKEKCSASNFNVSCILTMPTYQRKGYGNFLIEFSYLLSSVEGVLGTPEKPLSDLGLISYRKFWKQRVLEAISDVREPTTITQISSLTGMTNDDVVSALENCNMLRVSEASVDGPPEFYIEIDTEEIENSLKKFNLKPQLRVNPENLCWNPHKFNDR
ncbi:hypothetical protein ROZALSC1DRAFT_27499 [Rozella allomycis CSF55]|uniref:Histone acetyltransferase n=1 Tax=Rozella allomycis (strain CSF55) TaxID=988480 RepID=A0A4V1J0C3_ROZAC|nr:hypothetical protein ROZALSC1DRAFT_27499 [Rozella allomycis CSF55]